MASKDPEAGAILALNCHVCKCALKIWGTSGPWFWRKFVSPGKIVGGQACFSEAIIIATAIGGRFFWRKMSARKREAIICKCLCEREADIPTIKKDPCKFELSLCVIISQCSSRAIHCNGERGRDESLCSTISPVHFLQYIQHSEIISQWSSVVIPTRDSLVQ